MAPTAGSALTLPATSSGEDEFDRTIAREQARAREQVANLTRSLRDLIDSTQMVATDDEHDPEGHTIALERQQLAAVLDNARARLAELDDARARLAAGTYGICERCGRAIGTERLAARPATRTCVNCAAHRS